MHDIDAKIEKYAKTVVLNEKLIKKMTPDEALDELVKQSQDMGLYDMQFIRIEESRLPNPHKKD